MLSADAIEERFTPAQILLEHHLLNKRRRRRQLEDVQIIEHAVQQGVAKAFNGE